MLSLQRFDSGSESKAYNYSIQATTKAAFILAILEAIYLDHKSYIGAIFVDAQENSHSIACKSKYPIGRQKLAFPTYQNGGLVCGNDTQKVN